MKTKSIYDHNHNCYTVLVCGFSLPLGNNYDFPILIDALEVCGIMEELKEINCSLDDLFILQYKGLYGLHREYVSASDLFD